VKTDTLIRDVASSAADFAVLYFVPSHNIATKRRWWRRFYDCVVSSLHAYEALRHERRTEPSRN
jgi:hypothetical protein